MLVSEKLIIYCDGGSRGNPGPSASAFVASDGQKVIYKDSRFLGNETNNYAEYKAVLMAVEWIVSQLEILNSKFQILINLDSQLVQRQLTGIYKIKNEKLKIIADEILRIIKNNNISIHFVWNYREKNHLADALVNEELDKNFNGKTR